MNVYTTEKEELENIISAMILMRFEKEISNVCMNIDFIEIRLRESILKKDVSITTPNEFLDIILEIIPTIYKMYRNKRREKDE